MPAFGADFKYDNTFCFTSKATEVIEVGGFKAGNFETHGIRMGSEGDPFRAMAQRCVGQFTIINGEQEDNVRCEAANAAGDKVFGVATRKFDPTKPGGEGRAVIDLAFRRGRGRDFGYALVRRSDRQRT
jgi:hypothetical protein